MVTILAFEGFREFAAPLRDVLDLARPLRRLLGLVLGLLIRIRCLPDGRALARLGELLLLGVPLVALRARDRKGLLRIRILRFELACPHKSCYRFVVPLVELQAHAKPVAPLAPLGRELDSALGIAQCVLVLAQLDVRLAPVADQHVAVGRRLNCVCVLNVCRAVVAILVGGICAALVDSGSLLGRQQPHVVLASGSQVLRRVGVVALLNRWHVLLRQATAV